MASRASVRAALLASSVVAANAFLTPSPQPWGVRLHRPAVSTLRENSVRTGPLKLAAKDGGLGKRPDPKVCQSISVAPLSRRGNERACMFEWFCVRAFARAPMISRCFLSTSIS